MTSRKFIYTALLLSIVVSCVDAAQEEQSNNNSTTVRKLFTYAGALLPTDWSVVSILNDRAIIGFTNGSARNAPLVELDPRDRVFVERLQNGTILSTPLSSAKEKIAQWSSTVTSSVSKFGKSVKDQLDSLINSNKKQDSQPFNITSIVN